MAYMGFKKLETKLGRNKKISDPGAVAASIGRHKYGKKSFQAHAASGTSMRNAKPLSKKK